MRVPNYRKHSTRDYAIVEIDGQRVSLAKYGPYNSPASKAAYADLIAGYVARKMQAQPAATSGILVTELIVRFMAWAHGRYRKEGELTAEYRLYQTALRPLRQLYGDWPADRLGSPQAIAVRDAMIAKGYCRKKINQHMARIRRVWHWGMQRGLVSREAWLRLKLDALKPGEALDRPKVLPVTEAQIDAIRPYVTPPIWGAIQFQWHTLCRPGEALVARWCDIEQRAGAPWLYRPRRHKNQHRNLDRVIQIGPQAQAVLAEFPPTDNPGDHIFRPAAGRAAYRRKVTKRKSPKRTERRDFNPCYTPIGYATAIARACRQAWPAPPEIADDPALVRQWHKRHRWSPNRIRHAAATRMRKLHGLEITSILLGHRSVVTTEIYAEWDDGQVQEAVLAAG